MNAKTIMYCSAVLVHSLAWNVCAWVTFYVVDPVCAYLWTSKGPFELPLLGSGEGSRPDWLVAMVWILSGDGF